MSVSVKICGVTTSEAVEAAVSGGADFVGFVFYEDSPRHLEPAQAAALAALVPGNVKKVAVLVDPEDALIATILGAVAIDLLQLHGQETPARVAAIKARFALPAMKAVKLAGAGDLAEAARYYAAADRLLFDAKAPPGMPPGGNALAFDWRLLRALSCPLPWMLSGGLNPENLAEAVAISGARAVDVSSGVEDRPGHKDPARINRFLSVARSL